MERLIPNYHFDEDEKALKAMKEAFLDCPAAVKAIRALKIPEDKIDQEIVKIYDFVSDINFCKKCPGVNACNKETPRLCTKIVYQDGIVSRELVPCKKYLEYVKFKGQFSVRDFDESWLSFDIKKLDKTTQRVEVIQKFNSIMNGELENSWIYISGEAGTGRTFVAANLAIEVAKKEKGPVAFIDVPYRFKELQGTKDNDAFNRLIEKYSQVPVLVLDDLGNEYKSDFVRESILFPILSNRSKAHLLTIITSDFGINDFSTMYLTNQASKPKVEQIKRLLKRCCGKEINLGEMSIY